MNKIQKATEIISAMIFLEIPLEKYEYLKNLHGGIDGLYKYLSIQLSSE